MTRCRALQAVALGCLLLGCGAKPGARPAPVFPQSNEIPGWSKVGETRTFEAANLWQYIDGDAEKYIQAGVQKTLTANYRYKDSTEATMDIHVMATADGPRKIMESESAAESQPIALGDAARQYGASLIFQSGPYLVRLVAYQPSPEVEKALVELARGIERKLEQQAAKRR
jgi:hypothetical protein